MDIKKALLIASQKLAPQIKNPHFEAELLLSIALEMRREFILTHPEYILKSETQAKLMDLVARRLQGFSIAHLSGTKSFYGLDFLVNEDVLIPRPETELLVLTALSIIKNYQNEYTLLDLGTGSGAIIISLVSQIEKQNLKRPSKCLAIDISSSALAVAQKNASHHRLAEQIEFVNGDLLKPLIDTQLSIINKNTELLICANLPYLTKEQIDTSPSIKKEPWLALYGGKDGLDCYRSLFGQILALKDLGFSGSICILAEIDHTQAEIYKKYASEFFPSALIEIKKDLGGYERLALTKIN